MHISDEMNEENRIKNCKSFNREKSNGLFKVIYKSETLATIIIPLTITKDHERVHSPLLGVEKGELWMHLPLDLNSLDMHGYKETAYDFITSYLKLRIFPDSLYREILKFNREIEENQG